MCDRELVEQPFGPAIGKEPEMTAAGAGHPPAEEFDGGDRNFEEVTVGRLEGAKGSMGHAVVIMADRMEAGAVAVACLLQLIICPPTSIID